MQNPRSSTILRKAALALSAASALASSLPTAEAAEPVFHYRAAAPGSWAAERSRVRVFAPPAGACRPKCPSIILFHGGGLVGGSIDQAGYKDDARSWAARGYYVFQAEYRIASGVPGKNDIYPAAFNDAVAAADWVKSEGARRFPIDPDRMASVGGSAGGVLATHLATAKKVRASITYAGISDFWLDYKKNPANPMYWVNAWLGCAAIRDPEESARLVELERTTYRADCVNDPAGNALARSCDFDPRGNRLPGRCALLHEASPAIRNRQNRGAPVMAVHGKSDNLVPFSHALSWRGGGNPEPILIPGVGHDSSRLNRSIIPGTQVRVVSRALAFLKQNLAPRVAARPRFAARPLEVACEPEDPISSATWLRSEIESLL